QGVTRFDIVLHRLPEVIEQQLGDGARWGTSITYHLARDPDHPYRVLRALDWSTDPDVPILLGHADRLPLIRLSEATQKAGRPVWSRWRDERAVDDLSHWVGWALVLPRHLGTMPPDADEPGLCAHLVASANGQTPWLDVPPPLRLGSFVELLESHRVVLDKKV